MSELIPARGKRWGLIAAVLTHVSPLARLTARRVQEWARRGLVSAYRVGRQWVVALEDVLAVERRTRETVERLGTTPRGAIKAA